MLGCPKCGFGCIAAASCISVLMWPRVKGEETSPETRHHPRPFFPCSHCFQMNLKQAYHYGFSSPFLRNKWILICQIPRNHSQTVTDVRKAPEELFLQYLKTKLLGSVICSSASSWYFVIASWNRLGGYLIGKPRQGLKSQWSSGLWFAHVLFVATTKNREGS